MGLETTVGATRSEVTGTQCIRRSFGIMRMLAGGDWEGEKLVDIAGALNLSHPTAHRILKALEQEGIVERANGSQRYRLGAEAAWLGVAPFNRCPITRISAPALEELARMTGDSVFLSVPSHNDAVYVERRFGSFPIQSRRIRLGARRPMGVSLGGRAMMAWLVEDRVRTILQGNAERYGAWNCSEDMVLEGIGRVRSQGFVSGESLVNPDRRVVAVPVRDLVGRSVAAISLIAPLPRLGPDRVERLLPAMRKAARDISDALHKQRRAG